MSSDLLEQIDRHLASPNLSWLLGAGISFDAGIPLMAPLTSRVCAILESEKCPQLNLLKAVMDELPDDATVEHVLSHLGDYLTIADRSANKKIKVGKSQVQCDDLRTLHRAIVEAIAQTIRWGYRSASGDEAEVIGKAGQSIVTVDGHTAFVAAMFGTAQAGLKERRGPVRFFTTNYDTLLEDAFAIACVPYWDGFGGGAVAYRQHRFGDAEPVHGCRAIVVKLHGSIDWHLMEGGQVLRVRHGDAYPRSEHPVLIYPQSTKYIATQRDPFAGQFELLRKSLTTTSDNVLAICGYSFGDEHINEEIEMLMARADSKTTLLAFCDCMPEVLNRWRSTHWGDRVYVLTKQGLYVGHEGPDCQPVDGKDLGWWSFAGLTRVLRDGAEALV